MSKDAYWFSHDSNAKDERKIMLLIDQLGLEGYGIYWILVEILREQPGYRYPFRLLPILAKRYSTSAEKMAAVVQNYALFVVENDEFFFSESLNRRMHHLDRKREQARIAGKISGQVRRLMSDTKNDRSTDVQQTMNGSRTSKANKSKVNITVGKDARTIPPDIEDVKRYCHERKNRINPQQWYDHYTANGWMVGRNKMKDWRASIRTWESNNYGRNGHDNPMKPPPGQQIKDIQIPVNKL